MSWFLTEGQKLERKEKWKEAAEWYETQKQIDDALRCWYRHFYTSPINYAKCLEKHKKYLQAAERYLEDDNDFNKQDLKDRLRYAFSCYKTAGLYREGANSFLCKSNLGKNYDEEVKSSYISWATELFREGKLYKDAFEAILNWEVPNRQVYHENTMMNIFLIMREKLPLHEFVLFLKKFWFCYAQACWMGKDKTHDFMHYTGVFDIIDTLGNDPFVKEIVQTFILYIGGTDYNPESKHKLGNSFLSISRYLCSGRPLVAVEFCTQCLVEKRPPLPNGDWNNQNTTTVWLDELSKAYIASSEPDKAIEVYSSRYRFGEEAEVLEELDRIDEAIALLEQSGAANYRTRDISWDKQLIDPLVRERFWREKIAQLKGRIATTKHLKKSEEKPSKPSLNDLDKMLALGEITTEEYEKMKLHSEDEKTKSIKQD
jgi:hypothetical protein